MSSFCGQRAASLQHVYHTGCLYGQWQLEGFLVAVLQALLHRAKFKRPFGILKYAMTLDGKIATSSGHAAWISSPVSRQVCKPPEKCFTE